MNSYKVTAYYKDLSERYPILKRSFLPDEREEEILHYEVSDPLNEKEHEVTDGLIHRYRDRVLFLVTDNCDLYCRHCFRRDYIDDGAGLYTEAQLKEAASYIEEHKEVHEVILSGGDPLTIPLDKLEVLLETFSGVRENLIIRIGSRVPIVNPESINSDLLAILSRFKPLFMVLQCNHRYELTEEVRSSVSKLQNAGVVLLNQGVLLKGINDSVKELTKLCHRLLDFGIKPYYIFQGDLAKGTSHFRVPIDRGLELFRELRTEISGLAMPTYAVDIPGGGGKIPLTEDYIDRVDDDYYYLKNSEGFIGKYPRE